MKRKLFLTVLILLVCSGCSKQSDLDKMGTVKYTHPKAGFSIDIPKSWEKSLENNISVGFAGSDPEAALNIVFEIGGYDYLSLDSLAQEVCVFLGKKVNNLELGGIKSKYQNGWETCSFEVRGVLPDNCIVVIRGFLFEPDIGIRYYLLFTSTADDYPKLKSIFDRIANSFNIVKSKEELYKKITGTEKEKAKAD